MLNGAVVQSNDNGKGFSEVWGWLENITTQENILEIGDRRNQLETAGGRIAHRLPLQH
jgi:hypothetical protein